MGPIYEEKVKSFFAEWVYFVPDRVEMYFWHLYV